MVCLACHPPERKAQQPLFVFLPVYPELVALIGWNVPNYQGVFLRGYGGQTSYHYGAVGHWSVESGELQGDTIRNITGDIESVLNRGGYHSGPGVYSGFVSGIDCILPQS